MKRCQKAPEPLRRENTSQAENVFKEGGRLIFSLGAMLSEKASGTPPLYGAIKCRKSLFFGIWVVTRVKQFSSLSGAGIFLFL
jgi:hypothetical protein